MLTKLSSTDIIAVTLATALLVSTSLLATLENLERVMAAARSLLLIIILILNTTACVAVVEMVRFFSVEKHFLLTVTVLYSHRNCLLFVLFCSNIDILAV